MASSRCPMDRPRRYPIHNVKQPSFFRPGSFRVRVLLPSFSPSSRPTPIEGLAERREAYSLRHVARVRRDATLARHGTPPGATGRPTSRRSTVACRPLPALPFPALPPGPARRPLATRHFCPAAVAGLPSRLRAATTPHPAPPSGSSPDDAPHERDLRYIAQARDVVNIIFITY